VQLGFFHGVEFAWARLKRPGLRPLLITVNERPFLRASLVVRKDTKAADFGGLKGASCALPQGSRQHCRLFLEGRCRACGREPGEHFARLTKPASVEDALDDVVDGAVQATVVDDVALDCFRRQKPGRFGRLRVLQRSEVFPAAVVAYCPGAVDEGTLKRLRDGLTQAGKNRRSRHLLTLCGMTGFEEIPQDYERTLGEIAEAYPPPAAPGSK
jgi:hypothetical protein